jgi:hypothetical protein
VLAQFDSAALEAVARASKRSSALVREEMKQGLYSLATIACVAPWIGLFGNVLGIVNSFQGLGTSKAAGMAAVTKRLSESMWPTAFGLMVGVVALWFYRFLEERLLTFEQEMESASLDLVNQLGRFRGRFSVEPAVKRPSDGPMFGERPLAELIRDEKFWRRCMLLAGSALVMAWFVQALRLSVEAAMAYVPSMFGISCLAMYPVWTRLLRRRSGGLAVLGAAFCLCWILA